MSDPVKEVQTLMLAWINSYPGKDAQAAYDAIEVKLRTLLSASKPAVAMEEFATAVRRMRKDDTRGDTVFRCGFNGAIDAVLKLLAASPAAPAQSGAHLPCPICNGVEGCDHTVPERARAAQTEQMPTFTPLYKKLMRGDVDICEAYLRLKVVGSCPTEEEFNAAMVALSTSGVDHE